MRKSFFWIVLLLFPFMGRAQDEIREYWNIIPDARVVIDYEVPAGKSGQSSVLVFYALPNGNTIEQTAGKQMQEGDDWHFDIQHIRAQTAFVRAVDTTKTYVVAYLQAAGRAWTAHAAKHPDSYVLYPKLVDSVTTLVNAWLEQHGRIPVEKIALCSHSGGGRFVFDYIAGVNKLPRSLATVAFLDSNYGYEDSLHTRKLAEWLKEGDSHKLALIAYVDTTVVLNGKKIVSRTGGTGYKAEEMCRNFKNIFPEINRQQDTAFVTCRGANGRFLMLKKENPAGKIYHTVLVERNGFIHSLLFATPFEQQQYRFWGGRAYLPYIKTEPIIITE